ncbi:MAG: hypothetical protein ACTHZ9_08585 [Leucobacter sp.]|uniref:hypothetical protein n=1 Tax=Agrococcus casei TaxID=343512 RepID=UPI003F93CD66
MTFELITASGRALRFQEFEEREAALHRAWYVNVGFYAASVIERSGIPRSIFTPTLSLEWGTRRTVHILEQTRDLQIIHPSTRDVDSRLVA